MKVAITGVCASGKTTLVQELCRRQIDAFSVPQEHSAVPSLWQKKEPDVLILLDATLPAIQTRRQVFWGEERLAAQHERLKNARAHADLFLQTDHLSRSEVVAKVLDYLHGQGWLEGGLLS